VDKEGMRLFGSAVIHTNGIKKLVFIDPRVVDNLKDFFEKLDTYPMGVLRR